jgi:restriction endonuclease S subunit
MYKPYPKYKESGVAWLGEVPEGWILNSFRRGIKLLTDFESNGSFADVKANVTLDIDDKYAWYLRATDLEGKRQSQIRTCDKKSYDFLKKTTLYGEELLIAKRGEIGKIYLVPKLERKATLAPNLYLIRTNNNLNSKFAYYWFLSDYGRPELLLANKSTTIGALYKDDVRECKMIYPPLKEQTQIANYLNQKTKKIDTLIEKQQTLIELLKEKRQALISHVVTKGLDNSVPMKESGVAWLGELPEGWEVTPLKFLLKTPLMYGANESADRKDENDPRYIRITDIKSDGTLHNDTFRSLPMNIAKPYLLENNSLLLARSGATVGKTFLYDESWGIACFAGYLIKATIDSNKANAKFVSYFTTTTNYWQWLSSVQIQATIENVSAEKYDNLDIPLPHLKEQTQITNYLDQKTKKIDTLIEKANQSITLLKERRTALISAVVTGKVDVRGIVWQFDI